jgi:thioesterase domain-containing protein
VAALAALYVQDIVERIPQGPISLVGYSFGGAVALALAAALQQRERTVAQVILLDARPRARDAGHELDLQTALAALLQTLDIPPSRLRGGADPDPLATLAALLAPEVGEAPGLRSFLGLLLASAQDAERLLADFRPQLPSVPVHLLRVEGSDEQGGDYGWSRYGSLASVQTIPGQHYSILRPPYLQTTLQALAGLLIGAGREQR